MKIALITFLFLFVGISDFFATPQQPDILIFEGKSYPIYGEPLEGFFKKNPHRRPEFCSSISSLWRGYVAYMGVVDKEIVLNDIRIRTVNPYDRRCLKESKLSEVAPDGKPFKLDWFTGVLTAAYGEHVGGDNFYDVWKV